jgi:nucleoid-associated protein YgaU
MGIFDLFKGNQDKNEAKPDFSNVQTGGSSTAAPPAKTDPVGASAVGRTYTVVKGDSLSKIAKREYGDANKWRAIYEANRDLIKDPDLIYPGQLLNVPEA